MELFKKKTATDKAIEDEERKEDGKESHKDTPGDGEI